MNKVAINNTHKSSLALVDIYIYISIEPLCCQQYTSNQKSTLGVGSPPFFAQLLTVQ